MTTVDGSDAEVDALEAELADIDAEIDDLSSRNSGFDFAAEIRRLQSALFGDGRRTAGGSGRRFSSKRERVERIRELQRQREQVLRELADQRNGTRTEQSSRDRSE